MTPDTDVLILGGGCAGLSLAVALAERAPAMRVDTLEARMDYTRDRTWCFWNSAPHPFSGGVTHRWDSWRVSHAGAEARQRSLHYRYEHLPADRFYELAIDRVKDAGQQLTLGVDVQSVRQRDDLYEVQTQHGIVRSRWVFDSRPPSLPGSQPLLAQRFTGWHVRTQSPCFDASVVDLMDFQPTDECGRTMFFYVLPFSSTEALVEATYLEQPALPPADAEAALRLYLQGLCGDAYEVLYRESAMLPMGEQRPRSRSGERRERMLSIGTRGGRVKASSGYAFQRIQRQSASIADALAHGNPIPFSFEPPFYAVLDRIFLEALRRSPAHAATYFMAMFRRIPADTLVRFLSERASLSEILRVMLALPKLDFVQASLILAEGKLR
jgi:lycopene beta-cyclase